MVKYGRIEDNVVREVVEIPSHLNISEVFHVSQDWRLMPDGAAEGWPVFNGTIVAPDYYKVRRASAYPPMVDFVDGMVKVHSSDPAVSAAGDAQVAAYCEACLAVKAEFPKP